MGKSGTQSPNPHSEHLTGGAGGRRKACLAVNDMERNVEPVHQAKTQVDVPMGFLQQLVNAVDGHTKTGCHLSFGVWMRLDMFDYHPAEFGAELEAGRHRPSLSDAHHLVHGIT